MMEQIEQEMEVIGVDMLTKLKLRYKAKRIE